VSKPATAALYNGRIEFTPPANWIIVKSNISPELAVVYSAGEDKDGFFALQVLPENALITPAAAKAMVKQLNTNHQKANQEMIEPPIIEKDVRFAIRIHERYKTKEGKTADETHLFRQVAGRAMELDVQSLSPDASQVDMVKKIGEDALISAHWVVTKPGKKGQ
jgi:hypothetical protein